MNAVSRKPDSANDFDVVDSEDVSMEAGFGELRADVRHIRTEATDIKADVRATNVRLDDLRKEMSVNIQGIRNEFGKKLDDLADGMNIRIDGTNKRIDETNKRIDETNARIDKTRDVLTGKMDDLKDRVDDGQREVADKFERIQARMDSGQKELAEKIDSVKDSLGQSKIWALGLYIGLAGALLLVIAHGFKWL